MLVSNMPEKIDIPVPPVIDRNYRAKELNYARVIIEHEV